MSYTTTGSSNAVNNGQKFELKIKISQDSLKAILLKGSISVENLDHIATGDDLKNLTCELFGKTTDAPPPAPATSLASISKFLYDDNNPGTRKCKLSRRFSDEYVYLLLIISGLKCTIPTAKTELNILFKDKNNPEGNRINLPFTVQTAIAKPEILSFYASPTVLQGDNKPLTLTGEIKGDNPSYVIRDGLKVVASGKASSIEFSIKPVPIGDHDYTLEVSEGTETVTKSVRVRSLNLSKFSKNEHPFQPYLIGNYCVSQDSNFLFSLMLKKGSDKKGHVDHIGYTNEGFLGQWSTKIKLTPDERDQLEPFATSPMVHLKDQGEVFGRLLFIGGSYVKPGSYAIPMGTNNAVVIIDLDWDEDSGIGTRITVFENRPWYSRMGHSCAIFPHGGEEKIWLLGGIDEWGGAQKDVWVSGDGISWDNIGKNGAVNKKPDSPAAMDWTPAAMDWAARCQAGIAVELDDNGAKKALWIGGGFSEIGGKETSDLWKFEGGQWRKITSFMVNNNSYLSSGLAFIGKDTIDSTGMYLLGGYKEGSNKDYYFDKITRNNNNYGTADQKKARLEDLITTKNAYVLTAYFKGCLWYMVFTNQGDLGITYSRLFYWVPTVTQETLILT